jgi:hypothetical protein
MTLTIPVPMSGLISSVSHFLNLTLLIGNIKKVPVNIK